MSQHKLTLLSEPEVVLFEVGMKLEVLWVDRHKGEIMVETEWDKFVIPIVYDPVRKEKTDGT